MHIAMYACTKFQSVWRTSDFVTKFAQKNMNKKKLSKTPVNTKPKKFGCKSMTWLVNKQCKEFTRIFVLTWWKNYEKRFLNQYLKVCMGTKQGFLKKKSGSLHRRLFWSYKALDFCSLVATSNVLICSIILWT